jgi:hypothetical protein
MEIGTSGKSTVMDKPLPCIICGVELAPSFRGHGPQHIPSQGTMFEAHGNYGSTVWDPPVSGSRSLTINVCDKCLVENVERVAELVHQYPPDDEVRLWDPNVEW